MNTSRRHRIKVSACRCNWERSTHLAAYVLPRDSVWSGMHRSAIGIAPACIKFDHSLGTNAAFITRRTQAQRANNRAADANCRQLIERLR